MNKIEAGDKLTDMVEEGSVNVYNLAEAVYNWMNGQELGEFVEFLEDELGYQEL